MLSWKAVLAGVGISFGGGMVAGSVVIAMLGARAGVFELPPSEQQAALEQIALHSVENLVLQLVVGLVVGVLAGFVAGRIAKSAPVLNALAVAVPGVLLGVYTVFNRIPSMPQWVAVVLVPTGAVFCVLGGKIAARSGSPPAVGRA